jgi:hypothetical protein
MKPQDYQIQLDDEVKKLMNYQVEFPMLHSEKKRVWIIKKP